MTIIRPLLTIIFLMITSYADANELIPKPFDVGYTLYSNDTQIGLMERHFYQNEEGQYVFLSESKTTGFIALFRNDKITEKTIWTTSDEEYRPLLYTYKHTSRKKNRDVEIHFDWETNKITNRVNDSVWHMKTEPGILDKLLYQLTIMTALKKGKVPESYTIADGGKIKKYFFEYLTDEIIETPIGKFKTMKLARHKPNDNQETYLWCAYDLDYLPIKVVTKEEDDRVTTAIIKKFNDPSDPSNHNAVE